jgi:hypothetical protein
MAGAVAIVVVLVLVLPVLVLIGSSVLAAGLGQALAVDGERRDEGGELLALDD